MCFKNYSKKLTSFGLAFLFGLLVVGIFQTVDSYNKAEELLNKKNEFVKIQEKTVFRNTYTEQGSGRSGACFGENSPGNVPSPVKSSDLNNKSLNILYKPRPVYTAQARTNNVQGSVVLRVVFLASGGIGNISPVSELPAGLTEKAIAAAKQMKFEPQIKNGRPVTVIKQVQFNFTIY